MIHRSLTTLALAGCMLAPLASFAAENTPSTAPAKGPMVHVTLKNLSNLTQNLIILGRPVSLAANEQYMLEAPAGTQVFGADNTVKLTIVKGYNGAVASFR